MVKFFHISLKARNLQSTALTLTLMVLLLHSSYVTMTTAVLQWAGMSLLYNDL